MPQSAKERPRLILDAMLGRLARKLRLLGFDAEYHRGSDEELLYRAFGEGRIVVTKDTSALKHRLAKRVICVLIENRLSDYKSQLAFLLKALEKMGFDTSRAPSRCPECNKTLIKVKRRSAIKSIPAFVYLNAPGKIHVCPSCLRPYWQGTHYQNFNRDLKVVMEGGKNEVSY